MGKFFTWLVSHIEDFQALVVLVGGDLAKITDLINKIISDFPSGTTITVEEFKSGLIRHAQAAGVGGGILQWLLDHAEAIIAFLQAIGVIPKVADVG